MVVTVADGVMLDGGGVQASIGIKIHIPSNEYFNLSILFFLLYSIVLLIPVVICVEPLEHYLYVSDVLSGAKKFYLRVIKLRW